LFGWESVANLFYEAPLEVRKEILNLEEREFGNRIYHSNSEIGGSSLKWVPNPKKFRTRRLHYLHSITLHLHIETLLSIIIRDKQVDNYKLFVGQEEIKRIIMDIRYDLNDIVVKLNQVEIFVVSDSGT